MTRRCKHGHMEAGTGLLFETPGSASNRTVSIRVRTTLFKMMQFYYVRNETLAAHLVYILPLDAACHSHVKPPMPCLEAFRMENAALPPPGSNTGTLPRCYASALVCMQVFCQSMPAEQSSTSWYAGIPDTAGGSWEYMHTRQSRITAVPWVCTSQRQCKAFCKRRCQPLQSSHSISKVRQE
jgi:hypothetical protein